LKPGRDYYRVLTATAVLIVAGIAATVSFLHISGLALKYGQPPAAAYLMPLSVDGLVATSSLAMLRSARTGVTSGSLARAGLILGVMATIGANVTSGLAHGPVGAVIAGWPAAAFIVSAEIAIGMSRQTPLSDLTWWSKHDVLYVVTGGKGVKVGITHGDGTARLNTHKADGYPNCIRLFRNLPAGMASAIEYGVLEACESAGYKPVRGREYYGLDAANLILDTVDRHVSQTGAVNEANGIDPEIFSKQGKPRITTPRVTTPGLTRQVKMAEQDQAAMTALTANPDMSFGELAKVLSVSERTARRVRERLYERAFLSDIESELDVAADDGTESDATTRREIVSPSRLARQADQDSLALMVVTANPDVSFAELATELGVSESTARRVRARIGDRVTSSNGASRT